MKNKKSFVILAVALAVLIGGAGLLYTQLGDDYAMPRLAAQEEEHAHAETGEEAAPPAVLAPDFTVSDQDGNPVQLSDYIGKPVVLNFWASWCGPCQSEMPDFQTAYDNYGDEVEFLMVNLTDGHQETVESAQRFADANGYSFPLLFDTQSDAAAAYGVSSIPSTYFIGADGSAVAQGRGALDLETLESGIDMIMEKN